MQRGGGFEELTKPEELQGDQEKHQLNGGGAVRAV